MDFETISYALGIALLLWLGALLGIFLTQLLVRRAPSGGLLVASGGSGANPERVVLVLLTMGFSLYYFLQCIGLSAADMKSTIEGRDVYTMPEVPEEILMLLFGAQASYVTGKIYRLRGG